jgi:CubicO group peptidase (beta-lactamase class C family)
LDWPFSSWLLVARELEYRCNQLEALPGSQYSYCSASTVVLGGVLAKATGMSIAKFAKQNLFDPTGIKLATWSSIPGGWTDTGGNVQMNPCDMTRIGLLVLQNGKWNGEQVVPEAWIQQSIQAHVPLEFNQTWGNGYGYPWWLSDVRIVGTRVHSFAAPTTLPYSMSARQIV